MGESEVPGGSCNLARRQTHCSFSGRSPGELVVLEHTVVRGVYYCRYASAGPNRVVQRTAGTVQERRLFATEENGYVHTYAKHYAPASV